MFALLVGNVSKTAYSFVERMAKSKAQKKDATSENGEVDSTEIEKQELSSPVAEDGDEKLPPFLRKQKSKLLQLRDSLLDSMMGASRDTLRSRAEGSEASAFGMHQADAGSDAYHRDFALSLALPRAGCLVRDRGTHLNESEAGTYGVCEMSGKPIPHARLEAIPFARFTVECQDPDRKAEKSYACPPACNLPLSV